MCLQIAVTVLSLAVVSAVRADELRTLIMPADAPVGAVAVHRPLYRLRDSHQLSVQLGVLQGDKFVDTRGLSLQDRWHFTDNLGIEGGFSVFTGQMTTDVQTLYEQGLEPKAYDPKYMLKAGGFFLPVYGKFLLLESIYHFHLGAKAGLQYSILENHADSINAGGSYGPYVGTFLNVHLSSRFFAALEIEYQAASKSTELDHTTGIRHTWLSTIGGGVRW